MAGITLKETAVGDIPTPAAGKATLYVDDVTGAPAYKDDLGVARSLAGATGATGLSGPPGIDGIDGIPGERGPAGVGGGGIGSEFGIAIIIGDGFTALATGTKGAIEIPFPCTILAARLFATVSGSVVVDIKKATYSGLPTTASICAAAKPTLSTAQKVEDVTLSGWTTAIGAGDWLEFNVDSVTTIKLVTVALTVRRT